MADSGGVMGVFMTSFWLTRDPVPTVEALLRQIRHVIKVGGADAVGIANDFPLSGEQSLIKAKNNAEAVKNYYPWWDSVAKMGILGFDERPAHVAIPELNNIRRMYTIEEALRRGGFNSREVGKIMGGGELDSCSGRAGWVELAWVAKRRLTSAFSGGREASLSSIHQRGSRPR